MLRYCNSAQDAAAYRDDEKKYCRGVEIEVDQVNVKATTEEGLGFTGNGDGISSQAICAIEKITNLASYKVADK